MLEENKDAPATSPSVVGDDENITMEDLLRGESMEDSTDLSRGSIHKGEVILIGEEFVFLNLGSKMDGKIPLVEFAEKPKVGDKVEAAVVSVNQDAGELLLSVKAANAQKVYSDIREALAGEGVVEGKVLSKKREKNDKGEEEGYYLVDIGIPVNVREKEFINRIDDVKNIIGQTFKFKITKFIEKRNVIFMSRRAYLYDLREKQRANIEKDLVPGRRVKGIVKDIRQYGVFVDLGGIDGMIHVSDLSWSRNPDPNKLVRKGDEIEVLILNIEKREPKPEDAEKNKDRPRREGNDFKISLGYKQLMEDPWKEVSQKYDVGMVIKGTVVRIFDDGVFIQLEDGIDGFARREDISWARPLKSPKKLLNVGDTVEGKIMAVSVSEKRITISLKEVLENPWQNAKTKYHVGEKIEGKVVKVINTGAFVQLDEEIDGYIHVDNISWTRRYRNAVEFFKEGMDVEAVIIDMDVENQRINLSIKHFQSNPWEVFGNKHGENAIVKGKIVRVSKAGIAVAMDDGLEGFIPRREIPKEKEEKIEEFYKVGDEISAVVNNVRTDEKKIDLSLKRYDSVMEHKEMEKFISTEEGGTEKMGSFFNLKPVSKDKGE